MALAAGEPAARPGRTAPGVVAHEWGTFTSVAGVDGGQANWFRNGQDELPCFVYRVKGGQVKGRISASVRMETPVIYFYSPQPATVSVHVDFPNGLMTEWYPQAAVTPADLSDWPLRQEPMNSRMRWERVEILPGATPALPREAGGNHYYAARATDAAPLKVGEQFEKLLFYRGAGGFAIPYAATIDEAGVTFRHADLRSQGLPPAGKFENAILVEHRDGRVGFRPIAPDGQVTPLPPRMSTPRQIRAAMEQMLTDAGLYPREAHAMVETWKDAWLEPGTRIFYIVPRPFVDRVLPLRIAPEPAATERVFMGRLELIAPWVVAEAGRALVEDDVDALKRWERFWNPIAERGRGQLDIAAAGPRIRQHWKTVPAPACPAAAN